MESLLLMPVLLQKKGKCSIVFARNYYQKLVGQGSETKQCFCYRHNGVVVFYVTKIIYNANLYNLC